MSERKKEPVLDRFMRKVEKTECGCWNFTGALTKKGYGLFWFNGHEISAHRMAYLLFKDEIADGMVLDHLCRNPRCVNPSHLEPVTMKENVLRGIGISAMNAVKTMCKRGHEFNELNTYIRPDGDRACKACQKLRSNYGRV